MIETSILVPVIFILIMMSGYFSGSETALFSLSPMRVKTYRLSGDPKKQLIANLLRNPRDLLVTVFMLNTVVNILLQNVFSTLFGIESSWLLKVGIPLAATLIFGEIIPKTICMENNTFVSYHTAASVNFFHKLIRPFRNIAISVTDPISRFIFFFLKEEKSISSEELQHVLVTSEKHGVLSSEEALLVQGYIKLQEETVKEAMWPKEDIIYFEISEPLSKLEYLFVDQECTRIPVCAESVDIVLGVISARDYFINQNTIKSPKDLRPFLTKPFYVPETAVASAVLRQFEQAGEVLAIVVDEYGSVTGLIAREDLIEVVIGEISDRRDQKEMFTRAGKNEIIASGKMELSEFNELFDVELESKEGMVTLGGWLTEQLGDIPKSGAKFEWKNFLFQVLAADVNRVRRIYVRKGKEPKGMKT